jgi:two-component system sensor histidine kinase EvgS
MPEMDGFETLNRIRQIEHENIRPKTPVIALTGATFQEEGTTCLDAGFDDFVEKSFQKKTLPEIINKFVHTANVDTENIQLDTSIRPLIPEYLKNRKQDVEKIKNALTKQDFHQIEDLGHKMKGSGKCYGFEQISSLGHRIELSAKERDAQDIESAIAQMQGYLATLQKNE